MRRFPILLIGIGVTLGTAHSQIEVPRIKLLGRLVVFYGFARRTRLFVLVVIDEYLMAGGTNIDPRKPAMAPTQYGNSKKQAEYRNNDEDTS
jgi:hypothetical protein